jgi:hypothetical protein
LKVEKFKVESGKVKWEVKEVKEVKEVEKWATWA